MTPSAIGMTVGDQMTDSLGEVIVDLPAPRPWQHRIGELRQQYVLAIEAAGGREWRRLDVRVKHPAAKVKARSGYFGG